MQLRENCQFKQFNLNEITEFNPGLIYGFDPESSNNDYDLGTIENLLHGTGQYRDMFCAYKYAQDVVLPFIRTEGMNKITPEKIQLWLNEIHLRIASTLAKDSNTTAGEYSKRQVLRWHQGTIVRDIFIRYFSNVLPQNIDLIDLAKKNNLSGENIQRFLLLVSRVKDDDSIIIPDSEKQIQPSDSPFYLGQLTLYRFVSAYHQKKFTLEEEKIINSIVTICMLPSKYQSSMQKFSEDLLIQWKNCDSKDIDMVAKLASEVFYQITEIHPYFNGNGRTATCFMNIILRSLGKSSILIRTPNDFLDLNSSYNIGIKEINLNPKLFMQHIKNRIQDADQQCNYVDNTRKEIISLRMRWADIVLNINSNFPKFEIDKFFRIAISKMEQKCRKNMPNLPSKEHISLFGLKYCLKIFSNLQQNLQNQSLAIPAVVQRKYTIEEKARISEKLTNMTGYKGWNTYQKDGQLVVLLELDSHSKAEQLVKDLTQCHAFEAKLMIHAKNKNPVIRINSIRLNDLFNFKAEQDNFTTNLHHAKSAGLL